MKIVISCLLAALLLFVTGTAHAEPRAHIRFYKANKLLQEDRIMFVRKKAGQEGCHNFMKSARVYRINQVGFKLCRLFEDKDCSGKQFKVFDEDNVRSTVVTQGTSWYPSGKDERGEKIRSWQCEK